MDGKHTHENPSRLLFKNSRNESQMSLKMVSARMGTTTDETLGLGLAIVEG